VRDPFPELKIDALRALEYLAGQREYEDGTLSFSIPSCYCISQRHQ
jgi:hypothetical protein